MEQVKGAKLTDDTQVAVNWISRAPIETRNLGIPLEALARRGIKEFRQEKRNCQSDHLRNSLRTDRNSVENKVIDIEVGSFGQVLSEQGDCRRRVRNDLCDNGGCCRGKCSDKEHLYHVEPKVIVLSFKLHFGPGGRSGEPGQQPHDDWHQRHEDR